MNVTTSSSFQSVLTSFQVALLPSRLDNPMLAIQQQVNRLLFVHSEEFSGVPVLFSDIQLVPGRSNGRIMNESPHVHYHVTASLLVFSPTQGDKIIGKINKVPVQYVYAIVT